MQEAEEKALQAARAEGLNVITLKQQVSDLCLRLEKVSADSEGHVRTERKFEEELFIAQQAAKEIEMRLYHVERDLAGQQCNLEKLAKDKARLENDYKQEQELTRIERERNQNLEVLLAESRAMGGGGGASVAGTGYGPGTVLGGLGGPSSTIMDMTASAVGASPRPGGGAKAMSNTMDLAMSSINSAAAIAGAAVMARAGGGGASANNTPINANAASTEDLTTLYKTLEQQYALIGEMDGENVRLSEELHTMKQQQTSKSASANTTPANGGGGTTPAAAAPTGGS